ncbi:MAG: AAA family ATPase [Bacteroidia bacterium]
MIRIGYGQSNFESMVEGNFHYVDRTHYIAHLESIGPQFLFFLRPRRFGKSLWISTLEYYYGQQYAEKFDFLFRKYYIGKNPTPLKNSYLILRFDFSGIDTTGIENTEKGFLMRVKQGVENFVKSYPQFFTEEKTAEWFTLDRSEAVINKLFSAVKMETQKIYLLIDEYDHFTNELVSFNLEGFKKIVSRNGFVRKFYETIKTATGEGIISRIFVTGVSPVTVDSLTSGFNISTNISLDLNCHNLMGFTEAEVADILRGVGAKEENMPKLMRDMKKWYNGYLFHYEVVERLYNSDMVLYFANFYVQYQKYPQRMLDINIASDYSKVRKIFRIGGFENDKLKVLEKLIRGEKVLLFLTDQFSFEKAGFPTEDMLSLLFYMGFLTIKRNFGDKYELMMPNKVIRDIYFDYFLQVMEERAQTNRDLFDLGNALDELIWENNPRPILEVLEVALKALTNRDFGNMDEKHVQAMFFSYLNLSKMYEVKSEYESSKQYFDILMLETPIAEAQYEFIFEFKYEKKAEEKRVATVLEEAKTQMLGYLAKSEITHHPKMKAWVIVVVGDKVEQCEEVFL